MKEKEKERKKMMEKGARKREEGKDRKEDTEIVGRKRKKEKENWRKRE